MYISDYGEHYAVIWDAIFWYCQYSPIVLQLHMIIAFPPNWACHWNNHALHDKYPRFRKKRRPRLIIRCPYPRKQRQTFQDIRKSIPKKLFFEKMLKEQPVLWYAAFRSNNESWPNKRMLSRGTIWDFFQLGLKLFDLVCGLGAVGSWHCALQVYIKCLLSKTCYYIKR